MTKAQIMASIWNGPKSVCTCGHLGDGHNSDHGGILGHGRCNVPGCKCTKFTWDRFTDNFQQAIDQGKERQECTDRA